MSLDIRYFTNGTDSKWIVYNKGVTPSTIDVYNDRSEIPEGIRYYAKEDKRPVYLEPGCAAFWGIQEIFYPNFQKCAFEDDAIETCIAEDCEYGINNEYLTCEYRVEQKEK